MEYKSQYGQDEFVDRFFKEKTDGIFLDIGAYDGEFISNTYFFEKERNWTGICFEPNPKLYAKLINNRNCICIQKAVSDKEGEFDFLDVVGVETLGGLLSKQDNRHKERINKDIKKYSGEGVNVIKVPCCDINKILAENNIKKIDYCSIDTEGGELDIVKSIDFDKVSISIFTIENNYPIKNKYEKFFMDLRRKTVYGYLKSKGYKMIKKLNCDEVYVHNSLNFTI